MIKNMNCKIFMTPKRLYKYIRDREKDQDLNLIRY